MTDTAAVTPMTPPIHRPIGAARHRSIREPGSRRRVARNGSFRHFTLSQMAGQAADAMTTLALAQVVVFDLERGASPAALTRAVATAAVPIVLAGPVAGFAADRWRRRSTLISASAARALLTLAALMVPATGSALLGYGLGAALLTVARVLYSTRAASIPHAVSSADLVAADSLSALAGNLAGGIGAGLGVSLMVLSPSAVLCLAVVLHLASVIGFASLTLDLGGRHGRGVPEPRAGHRILETFTSGPAGFAAAVTGAHRLLLGGAFSTFVLLADARYRLESSGYAGAIAVLAIGGAVGTVVAPSTVRRLTRRQTVAGAFGLAGFAISTAAVLSSSAAVIGAMMLSAFAFQNLRLMSDAVVQSSVDDDMLGRVFTAYDVVYNLSFTVGALLVPWLWPQQTTGPFVAIGAAFCICAGVSLLAHRPPTTNGMSR